MHYSRRRCISQGRIQKHHGFLKVTGLRTVTMNMPIYSPPQHPSKVMALVASKIHLPPQGRQNEVEAKAESAKDAGLGAKPKPPRRAVGSLPLIPSPFSYLPQFLSFFVKKMGRGKGVGQMIPTSRKPCLQTTRHSYRRVCVDEHAKVNRQVRQARQVLLLSLGDCPRESTERLRALGVSVVNKENRLPLRSGGGDLAVQVCCWIGL